jgi:hypothetical protein
MKVIFAALTLVLTLEAGAMAQTNDTAPACAALAGEYEIPTTTAACRMFYAWNPDDQTSWEGGIWLPHDNRDARNLGHDGVATGQSDARYPGARVIYDEPPSPGSGVVPAPLPVEHVRLQVEGRCSGFKLEYGSPNPYFEPAAINRRVAHLRLGRSTVALGTWATLRREVSLTGSRLEVVQTYTGSCRPYVGCSPHGSEQLGRIDWTFEVSGDELTITHDHRQFEDGVQAPQNGVCTLRRVSSP